MDRSYIKIPADFLYYLEALSDEEAGRLFNAMIEFAKTGVDPDYLGDERVIWPIAKRYCKMYRQWSVSKNQLGRRTAEYAAWRKTVLTRDAYTCQGCGSVGGRLNVHHVLPWADFPDYRFDQNNGITLCEKCHRYIHRWRR